MDESAVRDTTGSCKPDLDLSSPGRTSQTAQDAPSWSGGSAGLDSFAFTSTTPDVSLPSFDPALAAFADLSFTQPSTTFGLDGQSQATQVKDAHDQKRMKVNSDPPALDSIDYWMSFDDDLDKMGSFEIDYSKRSDLSGQNRPGIPSDFTPGLGSGLYNSTTTAPFKEEDFFDDSAFEQLLSEDEDMLDSTTDINNNKSAHLRDFLETPTAFEPSTDLFPKSSGLETFQPGSRLISAVIDEPGQPRQGVNAPALELDEQRKVLEEALHSGKLPGALIPPNGFGIGFGAGMGGCNLPQQSGKQTSNSRSQLSGAHARSMSGKNNEVSDELKLRKQIGRASMARTTPSRKSTSSAATPKVRSADRIAHNDVERKYRTNLKDKIAELRAAIPALQTSGMEGDSEGGSAGGQQSSNKISKGTVLTKATEYILQLEARNKAMVQEHQQLTRRLQAFDILLSGATSQADMMVPNHSMTLFDPRGFC
ncbi:hypothetical protein E4U58_003250 [Claviceps cyperi]|nr:hypothetical protein E4U58_003250 [Claviceps cyperi]